MTGTKFTYKGIEYIKIHGTHIRTDDDKPVCLAVVSDNGDFPKDAYLVPFELGMADDSDVSLSSL